MLRASELGSAREDLAGQARGDRAPFTRAAARSIQP